MSQDVSVLHSGGGAIARRRPTSWTSRRWPRHRCPRNGQTRARQAHFFHFHCSATAQGRTLLGHQSRHASSIMQRHLMKVCRCEIPVSCPHTHPVGIKTNIRSGCCVKHCILWIISLCGKHSHIDPQPPQAKRLKNKTQIHHPFREMRIVYRGFITLVMFFVFPRFLAHIQKVAKVASHSEKSTL